MTRQRCAAPVAAALLLVALGGAARPVLAQRQAGAGSALVRTATAYPTGDRATSVLLLERFVPAEVRAGTEFEYHIRLTNLTRLELRDVTLTEQFPPGFRLQATAPQTGLDREGRRGTWTWARLAPGAAETIRVRGAVERAEALAICGTVTFAEDFCATVAVVEPGLALTKSAPREVLVCDPIPLRFVVSNPGTGAVRNVRVTDTFPEGLTTPDGQTGLVFEAGTLAPGQSREFSATVQAARPGEYRNTARAEDDSGLTAQAPATTVVRQPVLGLTKRGPELRYVGRTATFELTVQNTGDGPARDTVLTDPLPPGTELVAAGGGRLAAGAVTWNLGTLGPRESRRVELTLKLNQVGPVRNTATAQAYCAQATASATVEVRGIPAVLLEVVDDPDPIEVGGEVTYTIVVTNQGSAVGTNIVVQCILPAEFRYLSATGPTEATARERAVRFAPLAALAPRASAVYKVVAQGTGEADARVKVSMQSDQTTSPVEESESTHIY